MPPIKMVQLNAASAFRNLVPLNITGSATHDTDIGRAEKTPSVETTHQTSSNAEFDLQARRLIIQQIHSKSGSIISQFPNEALLKLRDYLTNQSDVALLSPTDQTA